MARYSHSKVNCFENCAYQYKLKYIDKLEPDIPTTIEAFMGDMVHRTLEILYKKLQDSGWRLSIEELVLYYDKIWEREYREEILIVKKGLTENHYRNLGRTFIRNYYEKYYPFNHLEILGIETADFLKLPDGSIWHVRMDMLAKDEEGNYYVIDHKTNSKMKEQWEADKDEQLAMYSIWVKKNHIDAKEVKLVWNMLAFNEQVTSKRTNEQLEKLQEQIMIKIARIENTTEYPAKISALCNYCGYQNICPYFKKAKEEGRV